MHKQIIKMDKIKKNLEEVGIFWKLERIVTLIAKYEN